jgi:hypothetical protein
VPSDEPELNVDLDVAGMSGFTAVYLEPISVLQSEIIEKLSDQGEI